MGTTPANDRDADATLLLNRASRGDSEAANDLLPLIYDELRARAGAYFRGQPADHTLQPTALVHEAYMRMIRAPDGSWKSRSHFFAIASTAMRQILVSHARRRSGARRAIAAGSESEHASTATIDILALEDALNKLAELDARQARIVELRFFAGLNNEEVADLLSVSTSTVERQWRHAKAWLAREL